MRKYVVLLALLLLTGCYDNEAPFWIERHVPTTPEERVAVAAMTEKILAATPDSLSGHDQDWDDAIERAKESAEEICCAPTYWERVYVPARASYDYTGRWRHGQSQTTEALCPVQPAVN
jgi:hypothetical protein